MKDGLDFNEQTVLREPSKPSPPGSSHAWWQQDPALPYSTEPTSHLVRNLAYEIAVAIVSALAMILLVFMVYGGSFRDLYLLTRAYAPTSDRVALVTVGEEALYLWDPDNPQPAATPRAMLGRIITFLDAAGAEVVLLDYLLDGETSGDAELAAAAHKHGRVIVAEGATLTEPSTGRRFSVAPAALIDDATASGLANFHEERANIASDERYVRGTPLVGRVARVRTSGAWPTGLVGALQDDTAIMPSVGLLAAWLAVHPAGRAADLERQLIASCGQTPLRCDLDWTDLGMSAAESRFDRTMAINFRGPEQGDGLPTIPASRILRVMGESALLESLGVTGPVIVPDDLRRQFEGRVVVVASATSGMRADRFVTPFAFPLFVEPDMSGGRIHAQVIDTLISGRHIRTVPRWLTWPIAAFLALTVVLTRRVIRDDLHTLAWVIVSAGIVATGVSLFHLLDGLTLEAGGLLAGTLGVLFVVHLRGWSIEDSFDSTELDEHLEKP